MMSGKKRTGAILALTSVLWVFPSFGTHGMGMLRRVYSHIDEHVFGGAGDASADKLLLQEVDHRVDEVITSAVR